MTTDTTDKPDRPTLDFADKAPTSVAVVIAPKDSAKLQDDARQQFQEQIDFFKKKLNLPTQRWDDIWQGAHDRAFIVAGAQKADLLNDLRAAVLKANQGGSIGEFRKDFAAAVKNSGWTGWTGSGTTAGVAWRTRVIYQTNIATSYAAGRWKQLNDPELLKVRPYWRYIHNDSVISPRPQHKAWGDAGLTLRHDHPFWLTHFPPNGWGCMCSVQAVRGPKPGDATEPPEGWDTVQDKTQAPPGIDKGWAYAPGANASASLQDLIDAKLIKLTPELAQAMLLEVDGVLSNTVRALETVLPVADSVVRTIASAVENQPTWKTLGLPDLRELKHITSAPALLEGASSAADALATLRSALGIEVDGSITVQTPVEKVLLQDASLAHVIEKRPDQRERYANFVLPTLESPNEVWATTYDDGSLRNRYIKLFSGSKYDLLVVVRVDPDGSIFWNMMQRARKSLNDQRVGERIWGGE
jgi:hypothetical protein